MNLPIVQSVHKDLFVQVEFYDFLHRALQDTFVQHQGYVHHSNAHAEHIAQGKIQFAH